MDEPVKPARGIPKGPPQELLDEFWEPANKPGWVYQWSRGWRLVLILFLLVGGYTAWRGNKDYKRFKGWRARGLAAEALVKASTDPAAAQALLDQAAILAPGNEQVMRAMADFCEPRHDITALYALRQITLSGEATLADWERICKISLEWGYPQLAPSRMLNLWAAAPVDKLTKGQLLVASRWQASRGQASEAETRLLQHLGAGVPAPKDAEMEVALCAIAVGNLSDPVTRDYRASEVINRLERVTQSAETSLAMRTESARLLARMLLNNDNPAWRTDDRMDRLKSAFAQLAADTEPPARLLHELAGASIDLTLQARPRDTLIQSVVGKATGADAAGRLVIARWLNDQGCYNESIALCASTPAAASSQEWFTVHLDALFARKDFAAAALLLNAPGQVLPAITQQLFLYRIEDALGEEAAVLKGRLSKILESSSLATAQEVLRTAENLERTNDWEPALILYRKVADDERIGLMARLGVVRCLSASGGSAGELIPALQSVLQIWPDLEDARSDLIYLRLLEETADEEDLKMAEELTKQSPRHLAYRIPAVLALLKEQHPAEALAMLERSQIPWEQVANKGWLAVYGAVLGANQRMDEARLVREQLRDETLRPGERKLLLRYVPN